MHETGLNETNKNMNIQVLNKGFVRLVEVNGTDSSIVQAARVSYGEGTKTYREDKGLINYLLRNGHTSPFEMVEIKVHMKLPIFVARQLIRHRTANVNEYSARYSVMNEDYWQPEFREQSKTNKQGSTENIIKGFEEEYNEVIKQAHLLYEKMIAEGVAREVARAVLPVSIYTEMYWKMDLNNLFKFLKLRLDSHAQYEIRVYAEAIAEIVKQYFPISYEAFEEHILHSATFSRTEVALIKELIYEQLDDNDLAAKRIKQKLEQK